MSEPAPEPADELDTWFGSALREALDEGQAAHAAAPLGDAGTRYELHGELGRGGMGIVLRGRDLVLFREVAVKQLHPRHCGNSELVTRFVEEAQISGQLQHPGIVPIYDVGRDAGRPFFTMKLVEGLTLAALLARRKSLAEERTRFLRIFEQACLTVAYAHARGVIHRDLKPKNIMVGAFGEVQIMDWGFAKVLAGHDDGIETARTRTHETDSRPGTTFGTLAYMPLEQAIGDGAKIDERTDVFALGATLCEILTGLPAYTGTESEVLALAHAGDTTEARRRLEKCDAAPELIGLARHCLGKDVQSRPRDARQVAETVTSYLAECERRAELARTGMLSARRATRLTQALAAALLLSLATGIGWWSYAQRQDLAASFRDDLDHVTSMRHAAEKDFASENPYAEAELACERLLENGKRAGVPATLVQKGDAEREAIRTERRDTRMRRSLEVVRIPQNHCVVLGSASNREARRRLKEYAAAFQCHDRRFLPLDTDLSTLVTLVKESLIQDTLVSALDDWALAALTVVWSGSKPGPDDPEAHLYELAKNLLEIARLADRFPEPAGLRTRLQDPELRGPLLRTQPIRDLTQESVDATAPEHLSLLIRAMRALRQNHRIVKLLAAREKTLLNDLDFQFELGMTRETDEHPDWKGAVECYQRCVIRVSEGALHLVLPLKTHLAYAWSMSADHPTEAYDYLNTAIRDSRSTSGSVYVSALNVLGLILFESGDLQGALRRFESLVEDHADCTIACSNLARLYFSMGKPDLAAKRALQLGDRSKKMAALHKVLGDVHALCPERLERAKDEYRIALDLQPDFGEAHYALALVQRAQGEFAAAQGQLVAASRYESPERWEGALRQELDALQLVTMGTEDRALRARCALSTGRLAEAAGIYAEKPALAPLSPQSWDSVCALLLAADQQDRVPVPDTGQQLSWRRLALETLRRDFAELQAMLHSTGRAKACALAHLQRWRREPCLAARSASEATPGFEESDRKDWLLLSFEIDRLLGIGSRG